MAAMPPQANPASLTYEPCGGFVPYGGRMKRNRAQPGASAAPRRYGLVGGRYQV